MQYSKPIRLETRLVHRKDLELYERLRGNEAYASLGDAELLRVALRDLDKGDAFTKLVIGLESRLAGSLRALHSRLDRISDENQISMAFLEVLMRTFYFHTLPVPPDARVTAAAQADRRARKFIEDVASLLTKGGAGHQILVNLHSVERQDDDL